MEEGSTALPRKSEPETSGLPDPLLAGAQARVGSTLRDKWRLDALLGLGGAAAVYAATHRNGSRAAVKILHSEMSTSTFVRDRFLWEGYVANSVGHEGAVRVIDDDVADDGSLFLVTELLDGETLEERRARMGGRLPENEVLIAADQLVDVIAAAHAHGIVHRDIKPENVFLTRAGKLKVLDFGIARLRELASASVQAGAMIGTPAYMAPEHARGLFDEVDERSDIWACGATMFHLLSGRGVHEGRSIHEELANAMTQPAPALGTVRVDVGVKTAGVVDRALAFAKDMRWPDARAMQSAIREAYFEVCGSPITSAPPLQVSEAVPNRTTPPAREVAGTGWGPTSVRPVSISSGRPKPARVERSRMRDMVVGGVAALALAAAGFAWMEAKAVNNGGVHRASGEVQVVSSATEPAAVEAISPLSYPEVLLQAPPPAADPSKPAQHHVTWRPPGLPRKIHMEPELRPPPSAALQSPAPAPSAEPTPASESSPPPSEPQAAQSGSSTVPNSPPQSGSSSVPSSPPQSGSSSVPDSPPAHRDCQPPYVVDAKTGKKIWNVNCF